MSKIDECLFDILHRIFSNWKALRLGVENRSGGVQSHEKAEWIPSAFMEWISTNADLEKFEIEDFVTDILNTEFNLVVDDGSMPVVAIQIYTAYKVHQNGDLQQLEELRQATPERRAYFSTPLSSRNPDEIDMASPETSSEEEESEAVLGGQGGKASGSKESKKIDTVVDEDGEVWQVVSTSKKSSGKKQ